MRVLMVGVSSYVQAQLARPFQAERYTTEAAHSVDEAVSAARHNEFSIILVSLQTSVVADSEVIRRLRSASVKLPIIAISPSTSREPRLAALAAGADDVVVVPIDVAELVARMQAVVRRTYGHSQAVLTAGPLSLCLTKEKASVGGVAIALTGKEAAVLKLLMLRKNVPLSKETILMHLYHGADDTPADKIVDVFVCKIRRKLAAAGAADLIKTVWGRGYMISDPAVEKPLAPQPWSAQVREYELA